MQPLSKLLKTMSRKKASPIDNAERMEAVMYVFAEETSAFTASRYYAIEDMMLDNSTKTPLGRKLYS